MFLKIIPIFSQKTAILSETLLMLKLVIKPIAPCNGGPALANLIEPFIWIIIVHYLGLLQCSPVVNAAWIGSVLGALVRCILCRCSGPKGRHLSKRVLADLKSPMTQ